MTPLQWASRERVLMLGGRIHSATREGATAILIDSGTIVWLGDDSASQSHRDSADRVVDLRGRLVTPGFVDAHVHATSTGLTLTGLDLSQTNSLRETLDLIEARARHLHGGVMLGHGWDETRWPEGRPPTRQEIDRATWGSVVYLSRVDVHSAAVSSALAAAVPGLAELPGYDASGAVSREAHHAVREAALASVSEGQRLAAQAVLRARCAELGIVAVHEMAGPTISSEDDLIGLLALAGREPGPLVTGYWGELASFGGIERAQSMGAAGVAGDLFVDGAIGSRTASLCQPYRDAPETRGAAYLDAGQIAAHVEAATRAGVQAGFHVIGDAASKEVIDGFEIAAGALGDDAIRNAGHRLEHAELLSDDDIGSMARLGIIASMQPMFDGLWGGPGGMYEQRLGPGRAARMNRIADLIDAGVPTAFGSDAPVTALGPWQAMQAAVHHSVTAQRVSVSAALTAHTAAGWRAAGSPATGSPATGTIAIGAPAHLAAWSVADVADDGLPRLGTGSPMPECERTVVAGCTVFDSGVLD